MKLPFRGRVCFLGFLLGGFLANPSVQAQKLPNVISWGENMSGWTSKLGLSTLREGCSVTPAECAPYVTNLANEAGVSQVYVSMPFDLTNSPSWAAQYSQLSLSYPKIVEVGFDDFVNKIENLQAAGSMPNPSAWVTTVINNIKSKNPNLKFGVTIYEDSLTHAVLTDAVLPLALRARIDYVHLFVHYRADAPNYAANVATAKKIFPNAKIMAGAYPYDRIDYLPCAYKGTVACTLSQEQSYYQQLLNTQISLLKAGTVSGLEFFFGYFGDPQDWGGWQTQARVCNSARLSQCYSNTTTLQNMSYNTVQAAMASGGGTAAAALQYSSLYMGTGIVGKQSTPGTVWLKNTGTGSLSISSISIGGTNGGDFPFSENCPLSLAAGSTCTITIYFKPTATGTRTGTLVVSDNAGSQTTKLTGSASGSSGGTASVSMQYSSLFMGKEYVAKLSTPAKVAMRNTGTAALSISSITSSSSEFPVSNNCGTTLPAGTGCTITIYFKPSALGTRTGTITAKDSAGSQTIKLTGTGISQ